MNEFFQKYRSELCLFLGIALIYAVLFDVGITCPIKYLTGISCPGCGMSRACMSALRLDFAAALSFHPLWVTLPVFAVLWIFFKIKKMEKASWITAMIFCILMLLVYVLRMVWFSGDVITFSPSEGAVARLISRILHK